MTYTPKYPEWFDKAEITNESLPTKLVELIERFDHALFQWEHAEAGEQKEYLTMLEQTDAYISARIYQMFPEKFTKPDVNKAKLLLLKSQALDFDL